MKVVLWMMGANALIRTSTLDPLSLSSAKKLQISNFSGGQWGEDV